MLQLSPSQFLMPGLIDTHIHASQVSCDWWRSHSALIGQFPNAGVGLELTLLDWLQKYTFPTETGLADTEEARRVYNRSVGIQCQQDSLELIYRDSC